MVLKLPRLLLFLFLAVVLAMIGWNLLHDALVPSSGTLSGQTVFTVLPPDYDPTADPVRYGRIFGFHDGAIVFPDPSSARRYLKRKGLDSQHWRIYALAGDYNDDTYSLGDYRYSRVAMEIKTQVGY